MLTLTNRIDMRPGAVPLVIHLGQYDSDFSLVFELYSSAGNFTVESGTTAMIRGTKTDGNAYDADATIDVSAKTVTVAGSEQMTAAKGRNVYELVLTKSGKVLSTANFILDVERAAMDADTIASESVLKELNAIIAGAEAATEAAQTATAAAESVSGSTAQIATNTADIATNTADLADLKEDLNTLNSSIYDAVKVPVDLKDIPTVAKKTETSAMAYSSSTMTAVSFTSATAYDSYWLEVTKDCEIYTDVGSSPYYAIVHGVGFIGVDGNTGWLKCESVRRYRNSENNLPTESNKLTVHSGDVLAFTFPKDTSNVVYGLIPSFTIKESFAKSVDEKIEQIDKPTVSIETNLITITAKKVKYYIRHIVDASVNVDCWRVYKGSLLNDGTEYVMWNGSDADGVIKLLNESDFLGGFHGDEITTKVSLVIDGTEVGLSTSLETAFSSLSLFAESDIYHCNTSENAGIVCFKRNKIIEFDDDTLSVKNNFTAVKDVSVVYAHLAMLSCARSQDGSDIINSYTDNYDYKLHSNTDTINPNSRLNKVSVNTNCGLLVFEADKGSAQQYKGMVVSYDGTGVNNRLKWYFSAINESSASPIQLSNGDEICGEYTLSVI